MRNGPLAVERNRGADQEGPDVHVSINRFEAYGVVKKRSTQTSQWDDGTTDDPPTFPDV